MKNIDATIRTLDASNLPSLETSDRTKAKAFLRHSRRIAAKRFAVLTQHKTAIEHIAPLPEIGEAIHGVMDGRFSAWSVATAVIELLGCPVDHLTISTLGYARENASTLCEMLDDGRVRNVLLNVSDYFRHSDPGIFEDLRRELTDRGQQAGITRSHAKLVLFQAADGRTLAMETSANLRTSQNYEQFTIVHDADLYWFHRGWLTALVEESRCQNQ